MTGETLEIRRYTPTKGNQEKTDRIIDIIDLMDIMDLLDRQRIGEKKREKEGSREKKREKRDNEKKRGKGT